MDIIEEQVCGLEEAKKLEELGVKQDSYWYYFKYRKEKSSRLMSELDLALENYPPNWKEREYYEWYSAFTVTELDKLLPSYKLKKYPHKYYLQIEGLWAIGGENLLKVMIEGVIESIENKLIEI